MPARPCLDCGQLTRNGSRCTTCAQARDRTRGSATARGYDSTYQARRAALKATARREDRPCWLCGEPIQWQQNPRHPQAFSAHHVTRDKSGPLVAAHLRCNIAAGQPTV